ncbi:hypothetical protein [Gemmobacter sp. 24YEA27]|uniref:hypothetical protein n=1 Tax=Gemmobacter sp. 24YEA27 TaxID=3040672 RepID=UPI0024B3A46D|nr:hypothetical protein [Gemmobacter sp. 24YEA27]
MTAVMARILARYVSGALVAYGVIDPGLGREMALDPDLALMIGTTLGALAEAGYALAVRFGWQR